MYSLPYPAKYPYQPPVPQTQVTQPLQMDVPSAKALVEHFDRMRLMELQEDDTKFDEFIKNLKQVKDIQPQRDTLIAGNESLADYNLSLKPNFARLKGELISSYNELKSAKERLIQQQSQLGEVNNEWQSPEVLLALLQTETAQSEERSEKIASDFLDKEMSIEAFLEEFIAAQTLFYTRQFKVTKMKDLLQNTQQNATAAPTAAPTPAPTAYMPSWYHPQGSQYQPYPGYNMPGTRPY